MGGRYQTVRREVVDAVQTKFRGMPARSMSNPESSAQKKRHQRVFNVKRLVSFGGRQRSGIESVVCTQRLHLSSRAVLATFSYYCHIKRDCEPDISRLQYYYYSTALRCHNTVVVVKTP